MKKKVFIASAMLLVSAVASVLELGMVGLEATLAGKFLFLMLLNLNIIALLLLVFLVGRDLRRLYLERKRRVPGYRFKTRMVLLFVLLIAIPTGVLFLTALSLGSNYIERLFTPQFKEPIESTMDVAKSVYEAERQRTLAFALEAAGGAPLPKGYRAQRLYEPPDSADSAVNAAFRGEKAVEIIEKDGTDIVRAAVPASWGALVVETTIPPAISEQLKKITVAYEDYLKLEAWTVPLKLNFLLILGFSTLMVIFLSIWASLRIAGRITVPVRHLAEATEAVARGDLTVSIKVRSRDEIGQLIESFNRMVSELREGKESLQGAYAEAEKRRLSMASILENIRSGVISIDAEGRVSTINPSAIGILGVRPEDVLGRDYKSLISGIDSEELRGFITSINLRTFAGAEKEVKASIGGRELILRVSIAGLRDKGGAYHGLLVVFEDLTEFVKAQRALAWQEAARRMAHEIKNPLTPIKLSAERMLKKWYEGGAEGVGPVFERSIKTIIREVDGLRRLVDEFSRFGKMPELQKRPASLMAVVEDAAGLYRGYKDLDLRIEGQDIELALDPEQFRRVLINLFDNAVEAMAGKGALTVKISPSPSKALIEVSDTGPGIKPSVKEMLFTPYFSTKQHGTGLGLAIARRIVAEHGGTIGAEEGKPKGSVFIIELPIKEAPND